MRHDPGRRARLKRRYRVWLGRRRAARSGGLIPDPDTIYWLDPRRIIRLLGPIPGGLIPNPDAIHWLDPRNIFRRRTWPRRGFSAYLDRARVFDGDWDCCPDTFASLAIYRAFEHRMRGGEWRDTEMYQQAAHEIAAGQKPWHCSTPRELDAHCKNLDALIESLRTRGYLLTSLDTKRMLSEVTVNVARNGEYVFNDGRHRLSVAKLLGLERIAVKVVVRHAQWQAFRKQLASIAQRYPDGRLPDPPAHPDLADLPASSGCRQQLEVLRAHLPPPPARVMELGAGLAWFSHELESAGYACEAVEELPDLASAADVIRRSEGRQFSISTGDPLETLEAAIARGEPPHVVLLRGRASHDVAGETNRLRDLLRRLCPGAVFILLPREPARSALELPDMAIDHTGYADAELVLEDPDGANIYRLRA
jgi:hypothetical protein